METSVREGNSYPASRLVGRVAIVSGFGWPVAVFVSWAWTVIASGGSVADSIVQGLATTYFLGAAGCFCIYFGMPLVECPSPTALCRVFFALALLVFLVVLFGVSYALQSIVPNRLLLSCAFWGSGFVSLCFYTFGSWQVLAHDGYQGVHIRDVISDRVTVFASVYVWLLLVFSLGALRSAGTYDPSMSTVYDFLLIAVPILGSCVFYWVVRWKVGHLEVKG